MVSQRICFLSQRTFPGDARLSTEVQTVQEAGYRVDVVCMRGRNEPLTTNVNGVQIYRIPSMERKRAGKIRYVAEYATFFIMAFFLMAALQIVRRYRVIHVTNLPDALVFAALIPKLLGAKIVFDLRECSPEMAADRFAAREGSQLMNIMVGLEQRSIEFADIAVTCTDQMKDAVVSRGADPEKVAVMLNVGTPKLLAGAALPDPHAEDEDSFRIITHGSVIRRYGHEVLVRAMPYVVERVPHARLDIFGKGELVPELQALVEQLHLENHVFIRGYVPQAELLDTLRRAHVGVIPTIKNPESDLSHTHKMYEFIALGVPVVISRTTSVEAYFDEGCVHYFDSGDAHGLADAIIDLYLHPVKRYQLAKCALDLYEQEYNPASQKQAYLDVVEKAAVV